MANPTVIVDFVANTSQLQKGMSRAGDAAGGFAGKLGSLAKGGAIGAAIAGVAGLAATLKIGFDEFNQGQQVAAQTNAVIKSTGGIANVTAGHVDKLATSIMNKTGIDDEAIKSSENLLLTFTNVWIEAGKGNDVFDQATLAVQNMSVAFHESGQAASVQLGKALNDPIKGMTALSRVGVTFTEQQKKQITAMVKAGNVAGAQKVILAEVTRETKRSAEAAGGTFAGKLNILKQNFNNLAGDIVGKMIPALSSFVSWLIKHWPEISAAISTAVNQVIIPALKAFADFITKNVIPVVQDVVDWVVKHWPQISAVAKTVFDNVAGAVKTAFGVISGAFDYLKNNKDVAVALAGALATVVTLFAAWAAITTVLTIAQAALDAALAANPIGLIVIAIAALVGALILLYEKNKTARDIIQAAWADIQTIVSAVIDWITGTGIPLLISIFDSVKPVIQAVVTFIQSQIQTAQHIIKAVMDVIHGDWGAAWNEIKAAVSTAIGGIVTFLGTLAGLLLQLLKKAGQAILDGLQIAWDALPGLASTAFDLMVSGIKSILNTAKSTLTTLGGDIIDGLISGIKGMIESVKTAAGDVKDAVVGIFVDAGNWEIEKGKAIINGLINGIKSLYGTVSSAVGTVKDKITGAIGDAASWLYNVGVDVIQGFINGIEAKWDDLVGVVTGLYNKLPGAVKKVLGVFSPSTVFFDIATDTVQGFIDGLNKKTPDATKAAYRMAASAVEGAHTGLTGAGDKLSGFLSQAFGAHQQAAETPAQKQLRILQSTHDAAERAQALADAQAQLAAHQNDDQTLAAQKAMADAQYAIQVAALQDQADAQAKALAGQQFVEQQNFNDRLAALQTYLDSSGATAVGARAKIKAITDKYHLDFADIGTLLGKGFASGLKDSTSDVVNAASDFADAVKKALKKGLHIKSPSAWSRDEIGKPLVQGVVVGMQRSTGLLDQATRGMISAVQIPNLAQSINQPSLSLGDSFSGDTHVRVFIGDQELTHLVRTEISNSNSGIARVLLAGSV